MRLTPAQIRTYETEISRIQNVNYCRIVIDGRGEIRNVDIVSDARRSPQRIVRDAEVIFRKNGVDLDHRKIGVVQMSAEGNGSEDASEAADSEHTILLDEAAEVAQTTPLRAGAVPGGAPSAGPFPLRSTPAESLRSPDIGSPSPDTSVPLPTAPGQPEVAHPAVLQLVPDRDRVRLTAVHCTVAGGTFLAEVELAVGSVEGVPGRAAGSARDPLGSADLVVRAAVEAVRNLLDPGYQILVRDVQLVEMAGVPVVAVMLDFGRGRDLQRLCGTCPQRGSLYETAVYATLDALNRRLGQSQFRELVFLEPGADES